MIINNTGLDARGRVGHKEIDSVTFERGKPCFIDRSEKYVAGEMCQVLNDHWGYAKNDFNYKTIPSLIDDLMACRQANCNFLLNIGPMGDGSIRPLDKAMILELGNWIRANKNAVYSMTGADIEAENASMLTDGKYYYAFIKDVGSSGDSNVSLTGENKDTVKILTDRRVVDARWLDSGERIKVTKNSFTIKYFEYGTSMGVRIARFKLS